MANSTILTHRSLVCIITGMTGIAGGRGTLEDTIDMAAGTGSANMRPDQFERSCVVIKSSWLPGGGDVAGLAALTHRTFVGIVADMTGIAVSRRAFEDIIDMTTGTGSTNMRTRQLEDGCVVIK